MATKNSRKKLNRIFIVSMLIVPIVHWFIFYLGVNFNSILMAFQLPTGEWSSLTLKDAFNAFGEEGSSISIAMRNTVLYFIKDTLMLAFNFIVSYFFYKRVRFYRGFQLIFYIPGVVSGVAIANMYSNFVAPDGPIGLLLGKFGMDPVPELLANSDYATWTIMFFTIWLGWLGNMLFICGAMSRIPIELLESAKLDGITTGQELIRMILPLVWPTMSTLLILNICGFFGSGGPILLFTKGLYETTTLSYWLFDKVKYAGESAYNEVAATGLILTLIGSPIILFFRWLIEQIPVVEY